MAGDSPYWNPKTETLKRERLSALQLAKLRYQCEWAAARSPWYRRQFEASAFGPSQLRSLDDIRRIPMLTRDQWMASQEAVPPYGEIPTVGSEGAIRVHTTSGTTGRGPLRALDSRKDWAWIAEMWAYAIWGCGVRPADTAYIAFGDVSSGQVSPLERPAFGRSFQTPFADRIRNEVGIPTIARRDLELRRRQHDRACGPRRSVCAGAAAPVRPALDSARRRRAGL